MYELVEKEHFDSLLLFMSSLKVLEGHLSSFLEHRILKTNFPQPFVAVEVKYCFLTESAKKSELQAPTKSVRIEKTPFHYPIIQGNSYTLPLKWMIQVCLL